MNHTSRLAAILIAGIFCLCGFIYAQQSADTNNIYVRLKKYAYKRKLTRMAFDAVFVDPQPMEYPTKPESTQKKNVNPYLKYEGKTIRTIHILVFDPFGYSVNDTALKKIKRFQKAANQLHITTRQWVIHNRLLFRENEEVEALEISETERMLRQTVYVNDARIEVKRTKSRDSVDVYVYVHDKWPITAPVNIISPTSGNFTIRNKNLFGVGQQFEQYTSAKYPNEYLFNGYYQIANIDETFISARGYYEAGTNGTLVGINFDRPFYSPLAKWAGGLAMNKSWRYYLYSKPESQTQEKLNLDFTGFDVWGAKSTKLSTDSSIFNLSTNIITGIRYYQNTFQRRPSFTIDTAKSFRNQRMIIGNAGFAIQQYYKEKFIYRFGATEDVPEGLIIQLIYGGVKNEFDPVRYYAGTEIATARHFKIGYLTATFSYGVLFNKGLNNDVTTRFRIYYFSDIFKRGDWYFRQFVNYDLVTGMNKNHKEKISISAAELYGFNAGPANGNTKMLLNLETVAYAPYNIIGFRFAPVLMLGYGMISDPINKVLNSKIYQAYALGILVRNENLLSSTFQISAGFYPYLPDGRRNVVLYSPVTSFTLRVRGFSVSKPAFIGY